VDKAIEWHNYTLEQEGKKKKVTAEQLKLFLAGEAGAEEHFAMLSERDDNSETASGFFNKGSEMGIVPETPLLDCSSPIRGSYVS
jgi:hypothetical protein